MPTEAPNPDRQLLATACALACCGTWRPSSSRWCRSSCKHPQSDGGLAENSYIVVAKEELTVAVAFTAISLFAMLRMPLNVVPTYVRTKSPTRRGPCLMADRHHHADTRVDQAYRRFLK